VNYGHDLFTSQQGHKSDHGTSDEQPGRGGENDNHDSHREFFQGYV